MRLFIPHSNSADIVSTNEVFATLNSVKNRIQWFATVNVCSRRFNFKFEMHNEEKV